MQTETLMMMMRMMIDIKKVILVLLVVDLVLIGLSISYGNNWLISSQSAFFVSLLVTISSFLGYRQMVRKRLEIGDIPKEMRDELDIIEDSHDLYSEDLDLKEVIKQEREKIGGVKNSMLNLGKSATGALSIFRLLAYGVLFLSFLYLNRHGLLNIMGYLSGLAIVPLTATVAVFFTKE
jgi:hypothetical protein